MNPLAHIKSIAVMSARMVLDAPALMRSGLFQYIAYDDSRVIRIRAAIMVMTYGAYFL